MGAHHPSGSFRRHLWLYISSSLWIYKWKKKKKKKWRPLFTRIMTKSWNLEMEKGNTTCRYEIRSGTVYEFNKVFSRYLHTQEEFMQHSCLRFKGDFDSKYNIIQHSPRTLVAIILFTYRKNSAAHLNVRDKD